MADDYENGPDQAEAEVSISDEIVAMSSELGYNLHPNSDMPINRAEAKQQRNDGHAVYGIIAETIAYAKSLAENRNK